MWKNSVNTALRRVTGYQLQRPVPRGASQSPSAAESRAATAALQRKVTDLAGQLDEANRRIRNLRRHGHKLEPAVARETLAQLSDRSTVDMSLTDLANLHGSDKGTLGPTPGWPGHNYTDVYEAYLHPLRAEPIRLLEIGLGVPGESWEARIARGRNQGGGASMRMWHDYFLNAHIYGADINPATHLDNDRVQTAVLDQGSPEALAGYLESLGDVEFDVIIDDGSHRPDHQQLTLSWMFPRLKPGGIYIVEDLLTNGKGDRASGRMSADTVLNTRRVLRHFKQHGTFEGPNALLDESYLGDHIAALNFHVPGRRYLPDTEHVCVIRKTG